MTVPGVEQEAGESRRIDFQGCVNFRDLGGYVTESGAVVRAGHLYRSDSLHGLTPEDQPRFTALRIATVIDLRTTAELEENPTDLEEQGVRYLHLPLVDVVSDPATWNPEEVANPGFMVVRYHQILQNGSEKVAAVLGALSEPGALPAVFFCAAGKDRTGLVAALLLRLLGVAKATVLSDYALSDRWTRSAPRTPEIAAIRAQFPHLFASDPATLSEVLDAVEGRHTSMASYAESIGVDADTVARLQKALLVQGDLPT